MDGGSYSAEFIRHDSNFNRLKNGLDSGIISVHSLCPSEWMRDWTLLAGFARFGCIQCVNLLLERGANPNHIDNYGRNVLHVSVFGYSHECAIRLIQAGACLETKNNREMTPLAECLSQSVPYYVVIPPWTKTLYDSLVRRRVHECRKTLLGLIRVCKGSKSLRGVILEIAKQVWCGDDELGPKSHKWFFKK
jgi:ankyrin repeat protein